MVRHRFAGITSDVLEIGLSAKWQFTPILVSLCLVSLCLVSLCLVSLCLSSFKPSYLCASRFTGRRVFRLSAGSRLS